MRTVFCQKPCCWGAQVWTRQVQGLRPPPSPTATVPSKVCRPGTTGPTLGHQDWAMAAGPSRATARSGGWLVLGVTRGGAAQRGAPGEPAQTVTRLTPSATTREPGGPLCPECPGRLARSPCSAPRRRCQGRGAARRACSCRGCTGCGGSGPAGPPSRSRRPAGRAAHQRGADTDLPTPPDTARPRRAAGLGSQVPAHMARAADCCIRLSLYTVNSVHRPSDSRDCMVLCSLWRHHGLSDAQRSLRTALQPPGGIWGGP